MNNKSEGMKQDVVMAYFMVPYQELNRGTKEKIKIYITMSPQLIFQPSTTHTSASKNFSSLS
jgi:hypothetical protein